MKKKNAVSDFSAHRTECLWLAFRRSLAQQSEIELERAFRDSANAPAPRFWVSEARAAYVVGQHLLGRRPLQSMIPEKQNMYREILRRFFILRKREPEASVAELVGRVVNEPAPSSYLSPSRAAAVIAGEKRRRREGGSR